MQSTDKCTSSHRHSVIKMKMILFRQTSITAMVVPISILFVGRCSAVPFWGGYHALDELPASQSLTTTTTTTTTSSLIPEVLTSEIAATSTPIPSPTESVVSSSSQPSVATPSPSNTSGARHTLSGVNAAFVLSVVMPVALMLA